MAKSRKGVTPPHLRPYLFKKGHGKVGKKRTAGQSDSLSRYRAEHKIRGKVDLLDFLDWSVEQDRKKNPSRNKRGRFVKSK